MYLQQIANNSEQYSRSKQALHFALRRPSKTGFIKETLTNRSFGFILCSIAHRRGNGRRNLAATLFISIFLNISQMKEPR